MQEGRRMHLTTGSNKGGIVCGCVAESQATRRVGHTVAKSH